MKACVISDLHGYLPEIQSCELLLIGGDIMPLYIQTNMPASLAWLKKEFTEWINSLPVEHVILVAGNHDFAMERNPNDVRNIMRNPKITYLKNSTTIYVSKEGEHFTIFGTPYCKRFGNWAFMHSPEYLTNKYSEMPMGVDIVLSHDSPKIGEVGMITAGQWLGENAGNPYLAEAINVKKPRYVFSGHIHSGNHALTEYNNTKLYNVSIMNERYEPMYQPLYLEIK